jgi:hypothetical protein
MDDEADEDADEDVPESDNELFVEPNLRFDPNEGLFDEQESGGNALVTRNDAVTAEQYRSEEHRAGGETSAAASSDQAVRTSLPTETAGEFTLQLGIEGLAAFASTPQPSPLSAPPPTRQLRYSAAKKPHKTNATRVSGSEASTTSKAPAARGFRAGGRDEDEARRYSSLQSSSNRLGGTDLYEFRDTVGAKRAVDLDDREASFAKAKRIRAMKATPALKQRLSDLENSSVNSGSNVFEMMLLFREENERKADARRGEEDQRRRDDLAAREARALADKAEAEERRRQDKLDQDKRLRREKEDARTRTQEMMLLIGAIFKKE